MGKVTARQRFRAAFERLKRGEPILLPVGTPVSQNNVAREAGCDPSALKKSRFPDLVEEIQAYVSAQASGHSERSVPRAPKSLCQSSDTDRLVKDALAERDLALSKLMLAHVRILELQSALVDFEETEQEKLTKYRL